MKKQLLNKAVILGLMVSAIGYSNFAEAGVINPGTVVGPITLTGGQTGIDTAGTYTFSGGTLVVNEINNNVGTHRIIDLSGGTTVLDGGLNINITNRISGHAIYIQHSSDLTIKGNLIANIDNMGYGNIYPGTEFLTVTGGSGGSIVTIDGNVDIQAKGESAGLAAYTLIAVHSASQLNINGNLKLINDFKYTGTDGGANGLYARGAGSVVNVNGDECIIMSIGDKPDSVSAKDRATININSKKVQIVGSIDFSTSSSAPGGTFNVVFDGPDSFWYGDILESNNANRGTLNATWQNGAQYIPFGTLAENQYNAKKYISGIELKDGGVINLYDVNAKQQWVDYGLDTIYPDIMNTDLDYVLIGDLKGSDGVFRLDMNDLDKANTDMIYILDSTSGEGLNNIEAYNENQFRNVSADNPLRFASVAAAAADKLVFKDSMNLKGEYLWDYQLLIGNSAYDLADPENAIYNGSRDGLTAAQIDAMMTGGTNWFIYGFVETPSQNTITILDSADAGYDMATELDRYNYRHTQAKFITEDSSVWVRMQRTKSGRDGGYTGYATMSQIGYEASKNKNNRYGVALDYTSGKSSLSEAGGKIENSRRGIMLYNTRTDGNGGYLDLTARYGRVNTDINAYNSDRGTYLTGDYNSNVFSLSAEAGKKHKNEDNGFFVEPQVQLQYARVGGSDYTIGNGIDASISSANSLIGRLGFRLGKDISEDSSVYLKADILREFSGGQDVNLSANSTTLGSSVEKRGTWYDFGVGADLRLSRATHVTFDVERRVGSNLSNNWNVNAAMYFAF